MLLFWRGSHNVGGGDYSRIRNIDLNFKTFQYANNNQTSKYFLVLVNTHNSLASQLVLRWPALRPCRLIHLTGPVTPEIQKGMSRGITASYAAMWGSDAMLPNQSLKFYFFFFVCLSKPEGLIYEGNWAASRCRSLFCGPGTFVASSVWHPSALVLLP